MGFWMFLTVLVIGRYWWKAYTLRNASTSFGNKSLESRCHALELEIKVMREKIQHLDEAVFLGDFELKRKFSELEQEINKKND